MLLLNLNELGIKNGFFDGCGKFRFDGIFNKLGDVILDGGDFGLDGVEFGAKGLKFGFEEVLNKLFGIICKGGRG